MRFLLFEVYTRAHVKGKDINTGTCVLLYASEKFSEANAKIT